MTGRGCTTSSHHSQAAWLNQGGDGPDRHNEIATDWHADIHQPLRPRLAVFRMMYQVSAMLCFLMDKHEESQVNDEPVLEAPARPRIHCWLHCWTHSEVSVA